MPQDRPLTNKLIFITYDNSSSWRYLVDDTASTKADSFLFGLYLYQRLKYRGLPVRTYGVDEAIGGAGFGENSIKVASPVIAVFEGDKVSPDVLTDVRTAEAHSREVFIVRAGNAELPENLGHYRVFDFRYNHTSEEAFRSLVSELVEREYPAQIRLAPPDAARALKEARQYYRTYRDRSEPMSSRFYFRYSYMHVFDDLYNKEIKLAALRDFAENRIMASLSESRK